MKPFNIEEAKAGKHICTKEGLDVIIISYNSIKPKYPIIAHVIHPDNTTELKYYDTTGKAMFGSEKDTIYISNPANKIFINVYQKMFDDKEPLVAINKGRHIDKLDNYKFIRQIEVELED